MPGPNYGSLQQIVAQDHIFRQAVCQQLIKHVVVKMPLPEKIPSPNTSWYSSKLVLLYVSTPESPAYSLEKKVSLSETSSLRTAGAINP